jgi:putative transposase
MSIIPKEVIKELIKNGKFGTTSDVMEAIKDMFKDVLQEVMEAELKLGLGYEKQEHRSENVKTDMSKNIFEENKDR